MTCVNIYTFFLPKKCLHADNFEDMTMTSELSETIKKRIVNRLVSYDKISNGLIQSFLLAMQSPCFYLTAPLLALTPCCLILTQVYTS